MKKLILSAIALSALLATGASAQSLYFGGGYGTAYYGGYAHSYAPPGPYVNVGSYDAYMGYNRYGPYGIRPATIRTSYGSSTPLYASRARAVPTSYRVPAYSAPTYVSPPYTLPTPMTQTYTVPAYTYRQPARAPVYRASRSYIVPSTYTTYDTTYGGVVNTVPHDGGGYNCAC